MARPTETGIFIQRFKLSPAGNLFKVVLSLRGVEHSGTFTAELEVPDSAREQVRALHIAACNDASIYGRRHSRTLDGVLKIFKAAGFAEAPTAEPTSSDVAKKVIADAILKRWDEADPHAAEYRRWMSQPASAGNEDSPEKP